MKFFKLIFKVMAVSMLATSCSSDDAGDDAIINPPLGEYENGFFVLNEGDAASGSVSFFKSDFSFTKHDIFGAENDGDGIGGYVQSIFFDGNMAFIISNGSNKITVVNRYTFKLIAKIETGFEVPRYGVVLNGKAYVTNLGSFTDLTDDFISVINLSNFQLEAPIAVNAVADKLTEENGKLYLLNGNYGSGTTVKIINPLSGLIENTIELGLSPNSFEEYDGSLYVLASGFLDAGKIFKISFSTNEIETTVAFPASLTNAQNFNIEDDTAYFTIDSKVYADNLGSTAISETPLFTSGAVTLYGFAAVDGKIYVSDAKDYVSNGQIFVYSTNGILTYTSVTDVNPNGFYFN